MVASDYELSFGIFRVGVMAKTKLSGRLVRNFPVQTLVTDKAVQEEMLPRLKQRALVSITRYQSVTRVPKFQVPVRDHNAIMSVVAAVIWWSRQVEARINLWANR